MLLLLLAMVTAAVASAATGCSGDGISRTFGARCDGDMDCDVRCLRDDQGYPGGFCTTGCAADDDCHSDGACADLEGGVCLFQCNDDRDCEFLESFDGVGWSCEPTATAGMQTVNMCIGATP